MIGCRSGELARLRGSVDGVRICYAGKTHMTLGSFLKEPLQGRTSLSRLLWLYGVLGGVLYYVLRMFLDRDNETVMRDYVIGGLVFSFYVTVAIYRCAMNCGSPFPIRGLPT